MTTSQVDQVRKEINLKFDEFPLHLCTLTPHTRNKCRHYEK